MSAFRRACESYTLFQQLGRPLLAGWPRACAALPLSLGGSHREGARRRSTALEPTAARACGPRAAMCLMVP